MNKHTDPGSDPRLLINIFGVKKMSNKIVQKAVELYLEDVGELGCINDASCECFKHKLADFALDVDRASASDDQDFTNAALNVRDSLQPIVDGMIKREHCVGGRDCYGARKGFRKTMLKDAVKIAKHCQAIINRAVNRWDETK